MRKRGREEREGRKRVREIIRYRCRAAERSGLKIPLPKFLNHTLSSRDTMQELWKLKGVKELTQRNRPPPQPGRRKMKKKILLPSPISSPLPADESVCDLFFFYYLPSPSSSESQGNASGLCRIPVESQMKRKRKRKRKRKKMKKPFPFRARLGNKKTQ